MNKERINLDENKTSIPMKYMQTFHSKWSKMRISTDGHDIAFFRMQCDSMEININRKKYVETFQKYSNLAHVILA